MTTAHTTIRLNKNVKERATQFCASNGYSFTGLVEHALTRFLEARERMGDPKEKELQLIAQAEDAK